MPPEVRQRISLFDTPFNPAEVIKPWSSSSSGQSGTIPKFTPQPPASSSSSGPLPAATFPGTLSKHIRQIKNDYIRSDKVKPTPKTPLERKEQRDRLSHVESEYERMEKMLMSNPRSAESLLESMMKLEREKQQILQDQKPGKTKRHRLRGKQHVPQTGRGLIHVPDPVLPHNDVSNDPYLIKSQHNSIVE